MELQKTNSFNQKQFNNDFEKNENKILNKNLTYNNDIEKIILPHQQTVENIIINIRDMIFIIIDMLENQRNPIPFILASDSRIFICSLMLIIFGTLLLILGTLLQSPKY
jgi:ABC-type polysaccharide/polyol phosphate export permease